MEISFSQSFDRPMEAIEAEKQMKRWSRKKKEALMRGDSNELHQLSECQNKSHCRNYVSVE